MEAKRTVISKSAKRRQIPQGSGQYHFTEQVVYHIPVGKRNGKEIFRSLTRHEIIKR